MPTAGPPEGEWVPRLRVIPFKNMLSEVPEQMALSLILVWQFTSVCVLEAPLVGTRCLLTSMVEVDLSMFCLPKTSGETCIIALDLALVADEECSLGCHMVIRVLLGSCENMAHF